MTAPTQVDPVAAAASQVIGGPLGRHVAVGLRGWRPVVAVLMAGSSVFMAVAVVERAPCIRSGWTTPDQFFHGCYSDMPVVYQSSGLAAGVTPYLHSAGHPARFLDQPVLSGAVMWLLSLGVPDGAAAERQRWYFALWALLAVLAVALTVLATARSTPRRPWNAAQVALSPLLVTASLVSVDVVGVLLTSLGLWAWSRRAAPLAGVLLGLAVASRSYPLAVLLAIGLVSVRAGRLRAFAVTTATAALSFAVVTLPVVLAGGGQGLLSPYRTWWGARAGYGSAWELPDLLGQIQSAYLLYLRQSGYSTSSRFWTSVHLGSLSPAGVTALTLLGWFVAVGVGALMALGTRRRPAVAEVAFVMLAVIVLTGKAVPIQAALWLLPLVALIGMRWRDHLIWAGMELAYFMAVWLYIGDLSKPDRGLPAGWFAGFLVLRLAVLVYLVVRVVQKARRRGDDEAEDELAGPLTNAPDRVLVRFS